jgi:multimeric flavodoxin WrbA
MKTIGFTASSRRRGNTAWVVERILEGARERGSETRSWHYSELNLQPCCGCLACKKGDRKCVIKDDMGRLHEDIAHADALILGSPVYMGQMSAQAKIFTDRLHVLFSPRFSPYFKERSAPMKLILAFTQGNPDTELFRPYYDYTKKCFQLLEFDVKDVVVVAGTRSEQAREQVGLDAAMKKIGSILVS